MRWIYNIFLCLFGFAVNFGLLEKLKLNDIKADFFLIVIICMCVLRDDFESMLFGFIFGLMRDIFFGEKIGLYVFIYMLIGYLFCKPFRYFYRENFAVPVILVFLATFFFDLFGFVFCHVLDFYKYFFYVVGKIIFPKAVYNVIVILFFYPVAYFFNKQLEISENKFVIKNKF